MKANLRIMEHIIRKYRPSKQARMRDLTNPKELTSDQLNDSLECGLENVAKHLTELSGNRLDLADIRAPQKKLYVLIIGNHSAGKSSFINWYIGE